MSEQDKARKLAKEKADKVVEDWVEMIDDGDSKPSDIYLTRLVDAFTQALLQFAQEKEESAHVLYAGTSAKLREREQELIQMQERESEAVRELCEALEPFAKVGDAYDALARKPSDLELFNGMNGVIVIIGDLRKAAAVLSKHSKKGAKDE